MTSTPSAERFTLMRCGVISLFHYANQVFEAEDGHLLLRGSNGSGKSTALELIAPLLFDGNLSAANLSTADGHRSITYHLLLDGLFPRRIGYAWIQFGVRSASGEERWVTLALGVKQARDTKHDAWFLVWDTSTMIDPHALLVQGGDGPQTPIARREAGQLPNVEVFDSAEEYRERVNTLLFGFSPGRYTAMIKLIRRLRSAQLGKSINVAQTTELLEQALPELDMDLLSAVGSKLDELDSLRAELAAVRDAHRATARFVSRYREFARHVIARELGAAEGTVGQARKAGRDKRVAERRQAQAQAALKQAALDLQDLQARQAHTEGELRALHASERWQAVEHISAAEEEARAQRTRAEQAGARAGELLGEAAELAESLRNREFELKEAARELEEATSQLRRSSGPAGVAELLVAPVTDSVLTALDRARTARRLALSRLIGLQGDAKNKTERADHEQTAAERLESEERELRSVRDEDERQRDHAQGVLSEALQAWIGTLEVLWLDDAEQTELLDRAEAITDQDRDLVGRADPAVRRVIGEIAAAEESYRARGAAIDAERLELDRERGELLEEKDRPPVRAPWRTSEPTGRALWQLCEFAVDLHPGARAGLERALEASGLLDARLDKEGHLRARHGELLLRAGSPVVDGRSLADVLVAGEGSPALRRRLKMTVRV